MTETTLLSALHALRQRELRERDTLDAVARRHLLNAIAEIRSEIAERERERVQFSVSMNLSKSVGTGMDVS